MNPLLRYLLLVLIVLVAVAFTAVCPDGVGADCGHACCSAADRSRTVRRLVRGLRALFTSAVSFMMLLLSTARRAFARLVSPAESAPTLLKGCSLRI